MEFLSNNSTYIILRIELLLILILFLSLIWRLIKKKPMRLSHIEANLVLAIIVLGFVLVMMGAQVNVRWRLIVGLLPAVLVVYQAFFLWLYQPKENKQQESDKWERDLLKDSQERAASVVGSQFGLRTLFIRYGFPAVLLGVAGIVILNVLIEPNLFLMLINVQNPEAIVPIVGENAPRILLGIKLGAVGAYTYVLLELGRRTFRHDITGTSAMWCLVTLVLGPVLAATVAVLWRMEEPKDSEWWAAGVVLFFTGFAPRRVIAAIAQAATELLKIGGAGAVVQSRLMPLTRVRGISPQIEERLSEEGIIDVNSLAEAEPIRLVRNTSFDMRQILSWIDEAILIETLPKGWEAIEEQGITGAIDLASYSKQLEFLKNGAVDTERISAAITELADKANLSATSLAHSIQRLSEDSQVRYVWALYSSFTEYAGGTGTGSGDGGQGSESSSKKGSGSDAGGQSSQERG